MSRAARERYLRAKFTKEELKVIVDRWQILAEGLVDGKPIDMAEFDRLDAIIRPFGSWWLMLRTRFAVWWWKRRSRRAARS